MGVHGLTSYVNQRSDLYLQPYKLRDCVLIIDGYGLASQLYNSSTKINAAFGGDYDKYSKIISNFFENLNKCKISPVVICDGGYEKKKLKTVKRRNLQRVWALEKISPSSINLQCFPLMMRHVFREKLLELGIPTFQTDFEADREIASLSKKLNAPVLSNDSDFYIFDVEYIPLVSMSFDNFESNRKGFFIPCQIFHVDNLLKSFGNLPKTMLPLLATVLGNDYINASQFKGFYNHLKMDKSKKLKPGQKRVIGVAKWLKNETFESALFKILQSLKQKARRSVRRNIQNIINGYTDLSSTLYDYLPDNIKNKGVTKEVLELTGSFKSLFNNIESSENSEEEISSSSDSDSEVFSECEADELSDEVNESTIVSGNISIPLWLLHASRLCNICPSINTLLLLQVYFYCPQIEDYECDWAGSVTLPILKVIIGLIGLPSANYFHRLKSKYVHSEISSVNSISDIHFPELKILNLLSLAERQLIIFKTLKVENISSLQDFPPEWQLFVMSVAYWLKTDQNNSVKHWHLHSIIIMMITINVIGKQVGLFYNKKNFLKKYGTKLKSIFKNNVVKNENIIIKTVIEALDLVSFDDCLVAMDHLIPYFHIDEHLNRNSKKFNRSTVHIYAQLQSTFEMAADLNSLLLQPFNRCHLGNIYNGTFLYNFTVNFKSRSNIIAYIELILGKTPSILNLYHTLYKCLINMIPDAPTQAIRTKRNKKKKEKEECQETITEEVSETEDFEDSNNRYSILSNQIIVYR